MRDEAWAELENKYPAEAAIALIRGIDQYLNGASGTKAEKAVSKKTRDVSKVCAPPKMEAKVSDAITAGALRFFSKNGKQPVEVNAIEAPLRDMGVQLPENEHAARVMIATAFRRRPDLFKKIPGEKARDPFKWAAA